MWIKILQLIASLSLLVVIHELGHFMFAKMFKCRVEKFYLFFNPWFSIFKIKIGETTYGLGWIPFGGYVKISGMVDESMDTDKLKEEPKPYEFRTKPAWQRLLIMVGGVMMNVVLAAIIYIGLSFYYGDSYIATKDAKYGFDFNKSAQSIGFVNGDKIISIDGLELNDYTDVVKKIVLDDAKSVEIERAGERMKLEIADEHLSKIIKDKKSFLTPRVPFVIEQVSDAGGAMKGGILAGDTILSINGESSLFTSEGLAILEKNNSKNVSIQVARDSSGVRSVVTREVAVSAAGKIGVMLAPIDKFITVSTKEYSFLEAIPAGIVRAGTEIANYGKNLKMIFSPKTEAYKEVGGVIAIGNIFPDSWNWFSFWNITALLSIMLAVMNILPIPALDGGHIMFLLYEVVTRRKPSDKFLERAQTVGMILLLALLLFANGNDVFKLVTKWFS